MSRVLARIGSTKNYRNILCSIFAILSCSVYKEKYALVFGIHIHKKIRECMESNKKFESKMHVYHPDFDSTDASLLLLV